MGELYGMRTYISLKLFNQREKKDNMEPQRT